MQKPFFLCRLVAAAIVLFLIQAAVQPMAGRFGRAAATEQEASEPPKKEEAESGDETDAIAFADVGEVFRKHCVRVFIHGKSHDGAEPSVGEFGDDIRNERPTPVGGYWWDEKHVVIHDPVLQDYFIRSIEISPPNSDALYPARVAGRFAGMDAILLEVEPDENGAMPEAHPLPFTDGDIDEAVTLAYGWSSGKWRLSLESGLGASSLSDDGEETAKLGAQGVFVNEDGDPLGLSFGDAIVLSGENPAWLGVETVEAPIVSREAAAERRERLRKQLSEAVLETVIRVRIDMDDDDDDWSSRLGDDLLPDGSSEVRAAGMVVGKRSLLVPVALPQEGIARIESIRVVAAGGGEVAGKFVGAFRNYMALLVETEENLPTDNLPEGFSLLNPLLPPNANGLAYPLPNGEIIDRRRVDYALGRRREVADYDRWVGTFRGYRGDTIVATRTNEEDGALAFDTEGRLVAIALTPRLIESESGNVTVSAGFRPVDFISRQLRADSAFDPSLRPVDEGQGQRLIDLGVEFQPLDSNTARLFHATRETRGGKIGLLVTHVYAGTIADRIGLREHDVLLRLFVEGRKEPMELRSGGYSFGDGAFDVDMSSEVFQRLLRFMPPPWPSRENVVSTLLTGVGVGRAVTVEYMREGEALRAEFTTDWFEPDYRSAKKTKFPLLGLTVKPVTYEVARFFNKPKGRGVVVSKVEEGGKGAVAGLHHYLLVTRVDGREVESLDDFAARVKNFENGTASSVELTVESFGKTRLVKIE